MDTPEAPPPATQIGESMPEAPPPATQNGGSTPEAGAGRGRRKPGQPWSREARDDLFRRKEAGVSWDVIMLDHPNRTRDALQQQYSIMRRKISKANGTWVSNRSGGKRKLPPEGKETSANKHPRWHEDEGDDAELGDPDAGESDGTESDYAMNNGSARAVGLLAAPSGQEFTKAGDSQATRSPFPVRGATEPVPRATRSYLANPSGLKPIAPRKALTAPESSKTSTDNESMDTPVDSRKRRKLSTPLVVNSSAMMPMQEAPGIYPDDDDICLTEQDLSPVLKLLNEKVRVRALSIEAQKSSQYQTFKASVARANRRAAEAEEKLRIAHHQYGEAVRIEKELKFNDIETLKEDFEKKQKAQAEEADERIRQLHIYYREAALRENQQKVNDIESLKEDYEKKQKVQVEQAEEKLRLARCQYFEDSKQRANEIKALKENFGLEQNTRDEEAKEQLRRVDRHHGEVTIRERERMASEINALTESFDQERRSQLQSNSQKAEAQQRAIDAHLREIDALKRIIDDHQRAIRNQQNQREDSDKIHQREMAAWKSQSQAAENNEEGMHATIADLQIQLSTRNQEAEALNTVIAQSELVQRTFRLAAKCISNIQSKHGKLSASLLGLNKDLQDMTLKAIGKAVAALIPETKEITECFQDLMQPLDMAVSQLSGGGPHLKNGAGNHDNRNFLEDVASKLEAVVSKHYAPCA